MRRVAIVGGGPAGLMAAETVAAFGPFQVDVFDAMPSVGRKFLMAGKGGMNITHAEPLEKFKTRYRERSAQISPLLDAFGPDQLRQWIHGLGIETFVGTSGRVFPTEMKAAPLLRRWLHRLRQQAVQFHVRHRWQGWNDEQALVFLTPEGEVVVQADAVILALGGGSWAKLGSDGTWVSTLSAKGVDVESLKPANCGFNVAWSEHFKQRFAGQPVKPVMASINGIQQQGEFNITEAGLEGGLIYALSAPLRDAWQRDGKATLSLDLAPGRSLERLIKELSQPQGRDSLANHLRRRIGLVGVKAGLIREFCPPAACTVAVELARMIKALPVPITSPRPIDEAISTAGGVLFESLDNNLMIKHLSGTFCAGEMLDWEAPTGGYLLTACFASGRASGLSAVNYLT